MLTSRLVTTKNHSKRVLTLFGEVGTTARRTSSTAVAASPQDSVKQSHLAVVSLNPESISYTPRKARNKSSSKPAMPSAQQLLPSAGTTFCWTSEGP